MASRVDVVEQVYLKLGHRRVTRTSTSSVRTRETETDTTTGVTRIRREVRKRREHRWYKQVIPLHEIKGITTFISQHGADTLGSHDSLQSQAIPLGEDGPDGCLGRIQFALGDHGA